MLGQASRFQVRPKREIIYMRISADGLAHMPYRTVIDDILFHCDTEGQKKWHHGMGIPNSRVVPSIHHQPHVFDIIPSWWCGGGSMKACGHRTGDMKRSGGSPMLSVEGKYK